MKNSKKALFSLLCAAFCVVIFACASGGGGAAKPAAGEPVGTLATGEWMVYNDEADKGNSTVKMVDAEEVINGKKTIVHHVTGNVTTKFQYGFAGWGLNQDDKTLELYKTAKSFSFWILGDGQRYTIKFKTKDIKDFAYYEFSFDTDKGEPKLIEVPVKFFMQPSWGQATRMYQQNVTGIEWQTHESWRKTPNNNPFDIKIWDFTVYN
jgi:hypothetical protein